MIQELTVNHHEHISDRPYEEVAQQREECLLEVAGGDPLR
jgi:hypothetical protein